MREATSVWRGLCGTAACAAVGIGVLAAPGGAAAAVISVGSASVPEGTTSVSVPVSIGGGEDISAISLAFAVGDGGPALGGSDLVPITAVSIAGGIFAPAALQTNVTANPSLPSSSATIADIAIFAPGENAVADGLIATFTLDVSGLSAGESFVLHATTDAAPTTASNTSGPLTISAFEPGRLSITQVPEPASLAAAALAGGLLLRRRRR